MAAVAAVGGNVTLRNVIPSHLDSTAAKLREMGVKIETADINGEIVMTVASDGQLRSTHIKTFYYPGFPTDMQPQFAPLMCIADGVSTISEGVWANRFRYVDELCKMGARISVDGSTATFVGGASLKGAPVVAFDLRAGAAMIIAGMIASGQTEITNVQVIDRGFYNIVGKLKKLGADIRRISE
jgi:UDP-N-acetylglucosamine 1-carboxyvinyltransferase